MLLDLLPESPERTLRELEGRQSVVRMLHLTSGYPAPETREATARLAGLAEKSGNLVQLLNWLWSTWASAYVAGDVPAAVASADQALDVALREGGPASLGFAHQAQILTRFTLGDHSVVEEHFRAGFRFFHDPALRQFPAAAVFAFGYASLNAWILGRADTAREREVQMRAAASGDNPYEFAFSLIMAAILRSNLGEYNEAEALTAQALELSEKNQFPSPAAFS
jgi:hypothetical protein